MSEVEKTDEELMKAYQSGDEAAFQALYRRHSAKVYGFVRAKVRDPARADDVFQSTFMKLHATRVKYDPSFSFLPWLFAICRSVLVDSLRKQKRIQEDSDSEAIEEAPALVPVTATALPSLEELSPAQRDVIELRYGDDLSFDEIAERLKLSPSNVRQLTSRSIRKLRSLLVKNEDEP